jgi:glycosyltransferase involved in cell wall biosynthesis
MRVLMISNDWTIAVRDPEAGDTLERHVRYAQALRRRFPDGRIDVVVKAPRSWSPQMREIAEALHVHPVPCARAAFAARALRMSTALAGRERLDVVTTQTPFDDGLVGVWLKRRHGVTLNVQMQSSFLDQPEWIRQRPVVYRIFNALGKWVTQRADTVRVVCQGEKARLERRFPPLRRKLVCLHPLVNRVVFEEPVRDEEMEPIRTVLGRRRLAGAPYILFVGRLAREKNLPMLLRAFALALRDVPEGVLVVVGDGPLRGRLENLARRLRIGERVVWAGAVPLRSLRGWYGASAGVVVPSLQEGFAKVVVESCLMERPVIATPFVSARELLSDGVTGFIAPDFRDAGWLAGRMVFLLRQPGAARAMGRRGREHVASYLLSDEAHLDRLVDIWCDTAAKGRRRS